MKKTLLIVLCLIAMLTLTACYTDNDPWPADGDFAAPTATPAVTMAPESNEAEIPRTYLTPGAENTPVPTEEPGREETPGING